MLLHCRSGSLYRIGFALAVVLLGVSVGLLASSQSTRLSTVLVVGAWGNPAHRLFVAELSAFLGEVDPLGHKVVVAELSPELDLAASLKDGGADHVVSVGARSAERIMQVSPPRPGVLFAMLPQVTYRELARRFSGGGAASSGMAQFLDQPFARSLCLLRLIAPEARRVAVLLGPSSKMLEEDLRRAAAGEWDLRVELIADKGNLLTGLRRVLPGSDAFLAVADPVVFNKRTVKGLLLTTYRERVPVFGFSENIVNAGALAAVHSTPRELGREAGRVLGGQVPWAVGGHYPDTLRVSVNRQVGRSLAIDLPSRSTLEADLRRGFLQERSGCPTQ